jgi:tetratricopeptide (TPR) repeat protein
MPPFLRRTSALLTLGLLLVGTPWNAALAADRFQRIFDAAVKYYQGSDYESALDQLVLARQAAKGEQQEAVVSVYEGIVLYRLGRIDEARSAFDTALVLDSKAKLPATTPSEIKAEFEAARHRVSGMLQSAPMTAPSRSAATPPPAPSKTDRPEQHSAPSLTPPSTASAPPVQVADKVEASPRLIPVVPVALLGAGVVAAGLGTYFGVSAHRQEQEALVEPFRMDALAKLEGARGTARTANILFGTAGLAVAGAVVTWFLLPTQAATPTTGETTR